MSETYNSLKKYAYWVGEQDPYYGIRYRWEDGPDPEGYQNQNPMGWADEDSPFNGVYDKLEKPIPKSEGDYRFGDRRLIDSFLSGGESPDFLRGLGIYHQIVRGILFNKNDPTTIELCRKFPYIANEARQSIQAMDPHLVQMLPLLGENILGGEVDYMADAGLFKNLAAKVKGTPLDWTWNANSVDELTAQSRKRTNSYSFANYAPGMIAAGLIPTAIGALMGRPFLGLLLGALLSGGVGYYGYNRLNNPNFQGYEWLDNTLGYTPKQQMTEEAQNAWNTFKPREPVNQQQQVNNNNNNNKKKTPSTAPVITNPDINDDEIDISGLDEEL